MDRHNLIGVVCSRIAEDQGNFNATGVKFSYLVLAVTSGQKICLDHDDSFLLLLRKLFPEQHVIWDHIHVEPTVLCGACGGDIPVLDAVYAEAAALWVHPVPCSSKK